MAIYPNNTPSDADLYVAVDNFGATLSAAIDNSQTTISLSTVVGLPTVGILTIDSEKVKYTGISGNDLTGCTRGFSATTAASHTLGASVWFNVVEEHHNSLKDEVIAVATDNRNTFSSDLNDAVSPTATAVSLKERLDMIVTQIKGILGSADWKDAISNTLSSLASSISGLTSSKKSIATGNAYKFETTGATGDLQETTVTASRAVVTDANGLPTAATTTAAEIDYVSGVTSSIQTQLGNKANDADVVHDTGDETVAGIKTFTSTVNVPSLNGHGTWGFRNRIINGDMRIDQRNAGATKTINLFASFTYVMDRWCGVGDVADGVFTMRRNNSGLTEHPYAMTVEVTTADASIGANQRYGVSQFVEGRNMTDFLMGTASAKTFTLSFWVKSTVTGTFSGSFLNDSNDRCYPFTYTISVANTWEYKTITVAGDTTGTWANDTTIGMRVWFDLGSGTSERAPAGSWQADNAKGANGAVSLISTLNANWNITGVQLELGNMATPFEYRNVGYELFLCQRYYEKSYNQVTVPGTVAAFGQLRGSRMNGGFALTTIFQVSKRTAPTMYIYSPNSGAVNNIRNFRAGADEAGTGADVTDHSFNVSGTTGTISDLLGYQYVADAEL